MSMKHLATAFLAKFDLHIERLSKHPKETLLGLSGENVRNVLDIGANTGQFARVALNRFPRAKIWCFEPLPAAYKLLKGMERDSDGRMTALNFALGARQGVVNMHFHSEHSPSSSLMPTTGMCEELFPQTRAQTSVPVEVRTLDGVCVEFPTPPLEDLVIKIDVQGYEAEVIAGGRKTIAAARAVIVEISFDELYKGAPTFEDLSKLLGETGHRFAGAIEQFTAGDGHVIFMDALFKKLG
ncbi:FkbM family methyltransferase [Bradyrhizobium sp. USDA 3311]